MRRCICAALLCVLLVGCAAAPAQTTAPTEKFIPIQSAPAEATAPAETTLPPETAAPAPEAPILVDYAGEDFNPYEVYWSEETDYITSIGFLPTERLTDVEFSLLTWNEDGSYDAEVLYSFDSMDPDRPFLAQVAFWGDMTTYGIAFTDESGARRQFAVYISGKDGSLICEEYGR